ncbi:MAG: hypothetical protein J6M24_02790 [Lachnospiraceae bacterium]|nr:hypothetical protein [Lachnospiraceae bacterium]
MFEFLQSKTNKELEKILLELKLNESNNYKDAAQHNYKEFVEKYHELDAAGKLNYKQKVNYSEKLSTYEVKLQGFTHKDQKPYWSGNEHDTNRPKDN